MSPRNATDPRRLVMLYYINSIGPKFHDFPKEGLLTPALLSPQYIAPSRQPELVGVTIAFTTFATLVVLARLYVTIFWPSVRFGREDAFFILAASALMAYSGIVLLDIYRGGLGYHVYDLMGKESTVAYSLQLPLIQTYILTTIWTKLSNLLFMIKVCPPSLVRTRKLIWGVLCFGIIQSIVCSIVYLFPCRPVSAAWSLTDWVNHPKCVDLPAMTLATNVIFVVSDFLVLFIPLFFVPAMKLPRRTTIAVSALWLTGLIACTACALKVRSFALLYTSYDNAWHGAEIVLWSVIELNLSLIAVTLPTIDMLLVKLIPRRVRDKLAQWDDVHESQKTFGSSYLYSSERGIDQEKLDFVQELDPRTGKDKTTYHMHTLKGNDTPYRSPPGYATDDDTNHHFSKELQYEQEAFDAYEDYLRHESQKEERAGKTGRERLSLQEFTLRAKSLKSPELQDAEAERNRRRQFLSDALAQSKGSELSTKSTQQTPRRASNFSRHHPRSTDFGQTSSTNRHSGTTVDPRVHSTTSITASDNGQSHMDIAGRSFLNI